MKKINLFDALKAKGVTLEDTEKKMLDELSNEINTAMEDVRKGLITAEDAQKKVDDAIKALPTEFTAKTIKVEGSESENLDAHLRKMGEELTAIKAAQVAPTANPLETQANAIKSLVDEVKEHKKNTGGNQAAYSLESKVAVTMTSTNTQANGSGVTVPTNFMYGVEGAPNPDVRIDPYITQFIDNGSTNLAAFPYADKLPTEGTMAITAEGALKPLLSVSIERRFSTAFKIAGRSKVTEEGLDDVPGLQALINGELRYSHDIAEQTAVYAHVAAFAPAFVAGDLAATTDMPSRWDAVRAAIYAVKIASKGRFTPNAVVINSADAYAMGATKDTTGQYVMPTFVLPDGTRISGVRVVETQDDDNVAAGEFIVGDWRKVKRRVYKPFNLRVGQGINGSATAASITSDFETNMYTFIGESRLHLWHYKNDETAFIKSDFDTVMEAIDTTV